MKDFRVLIDLPDTHFFIEIPFVPRKGDLIDVIEMIDTTKLTDDDYEEIYNSSWEVSFVSWEKDIDGFYARLYCTAG